MKTGLEVPPFFVFKKTGNGRDIQFLGLAVPGNPKISPDKDLLRSGEQLKKSDSRIIDDTLLFLILEKNQLQNNGLMF